jgi:ADP-ribose pyrophosphatase YjhB (NUDIX family)
VKKPRIIVRALVVEDGRLLVNRHEDRLALFGGRVEKGERAREALARELDEELGMQAEIGPLAFIIENVYQGKHELGLYYKVKRHSSFAGRGANFRPAWLPLAEVAGSRLLPASLERELAERGIPDHAVEVL